MSQIAEITSKISKALHIGEKNVMTGDAGNPVDDNQNSITVGPNGPILLQDTYLLEKLARFDRERIPERVVHAKGAGAYGYFEVTADVTKYTKAKFLNQVGKRTEIFVRFSQVSGERGSSDAVRDPRGFAIKHYTEDGIYDVVANNTPLFFVRDPIKFPDFIHTQKRLPDSNLKSDDMKWDFASLVPESIHQYSFLFGDRGIPATYRHMHGFGGHTFKWVNDKNEAVWIKLHYVTDAGIKNLTQEQADALNKEDHDHSARDLFTHIASGNSASWTAYVQIMPLKDALTYKWDIFDITKVWPHGDYPLIKYGKLVLNRNPINYFAEVEQSAFAPSNLVPGVEPSLDRMLQARLFSYSDTQRHRLGPNYLLLPVNCPFANKSKIFNQQIDGFMRFDNNGDGLPVYEPNSVNNPQVDPNAAIQKYHIEGYAGRHPFIHPNDDYEQPRKFYCDVLSEDARERLVDNICKSLSKARLEVQQRMLKIFYKVHEDYGKKVETCLEKYNKHNQEQSKK